MPVGTCRIWNPLSENKSSFGYALDNTRFLGFTHTSAGALQQVRFTFGDIDIPQDMMRFMIHRDPKVIPRDAPLQSLPDLAIIEISSAKEFTLDGLQIQINCMQREFAAFFAEKSRSNAFIKALNTRDQDQIDSFLQTNWSETEDQQEDARTLRRIRFRLTTEEDLRRDVRLLMDIFPHYLFVTHVDATGRDGKPVALRIDLIKLVSRIVREEGGAVYDPTPRMLEMGQPLAMPQDENHYSEDFGTILVQDWYREAIAPLMAQRETL